LLADSCITPVILQVTSVVVPAKGFEVQLLLITNEEIDNIPVIKSGKTIVLTVFIVLKALYTDSFIDELCLTAWLDQCIIKNDILLPAVQHISVFDDIIPIKSSFGKSWINWFQSFNNKIYSGKLLFIAEII
jgi:hypothetical protein